MSIRVLVADDQALVRAGFRRLLELEDGIDVVAEAADGLEAVERTALYSPDVVLMDIRMPRLDGIAATRRILRDGSGPRILVLTTFDLDEYVFDAIRARASGFLLKDSPTEELLSAVRVVAAGDGLLAPSVARRLIEEFARRPAPREEPPELEQLTARELEVLRLVARGLTNAEIAGVLVLGESTVKTHVGNLLGKLDLRDRIQAVVLAYECGLVQPGESSPDER